MRRHLRELVSRIGHRRVLGFSLAAPGLMHPARAQPDWPTRSVRFVVAFAAGGAADTVARVFGTRLADILGQSIVVENRPGGNAVIAASAVLQAARDGYTFLVDATNQLTNPALLRDLPFDYATAFVPVTQLATFPLVVAVRHDFPARTIEEFFAAARARPGAVSYGTPQTAGMGHLAGELLQRMAGIRLVQVPYRGGADAARDIGAGAVDSVIIATSSIAPQVAADRARILAVTSARRARACPDVPTLAERGLPHFDMSDWFGLFEATGVPEPVVARLHAAALEASRDAAAMERLAPLSAELVASTPQAFGQWLTAQRSVAQRLIADASIRIN